MVHRDLKPENVVGRWREGLEVRVLDLGLVKFGPGESVSSDPLPSRGP